MSYTIDQYYAFFCSAKDPYNFDADPDPGSALKKMDPDPGHAHFFNFY